MTAPTDAGSAGMTRDNCGSDGNTIVSVLAANEP